jgi:hypothetical protein
VETMDIETFPCNRLEARLSCPDALGQNIGFVVARPDDQSPVWTPPSRNLNLSRIKISEAYIKGLLGIVSLRIMNRIPLC